MTSSQPKPRLCFVQINALGLLVPGSQVPFGGAETRAMTFAKMLRDSGRFEVSFAVLHEMAEAHASSHPQGMGLLSMPPHPFHTEIPTLDLLNWYQRTEADCLLSLGANEVSHEMAKYAQLLERPAIVGIASDQSLKDTVFQGSNIMNEYGVPSSHAWEAMHRATQVLTQTRWQQEWLYRNVGKKGILIHNPIPAGWEEVEVARKPPFGVDFLWVGRPGPDKNPEILFDLARDLRRATFRMVVDGGRQAIPEPWRSNLPPNVQVTDRVNGQTDLRALMADSRAILNTSPMEGFPNLMLQSAMVGCPCLFLTVDPDAWDAEHGCAASAHGDVDQFQALIERALQDSAWLDGMAQRARERTLAHHAHEVVKIQLIETVQQVLDASRKDH